MALPPNFKRPGCSLSPKIDFTPSRTNPWGPGGSRMILTSFYITKTLRSSGVVGQIEFLVQVSSALLSQRVALAPSSRVALVSQSHSRFWVAWHKLLECRSVVECTVALASVGSSACPFHESRPFDVTLHRLLQVLPFLRFCQSVAL